jgi:hypothetical protein
MKPAYITEYKLKAANGRVVLDGDAIRADIKETYQQVPQFIDSISFESLIPLGHKLVVTEDGCYGIPLEKQKDIS